MKHLMLVAGIGLFSVSLPSHAAELALSIEGVRNAEGRIMIAVYDAAAGFRDRKKALARISLRAKKGSLKLTLPDVRPATYAVSVFHDENSDRKLDTNMLGIPTEGYGFSNDARGTMGPPSFEASAVEVRDGRVPVPIAMGY